MRKIVFILAIVLVMGMAKPITKNEDIPPLPKTCNPCDISKRGITLIKNFEGFSPYVYLDAAGLPTIGFGHLIKEGEIIDVPLLGKRAEELLKKDLQWSVDAVNRHVNVPLTQNQFDALVSLTFNIGSGALKRSTLLREVNAENHYNVRKQFKRWVFAGGKRLKGLERRRKAEAVLYGWENKDAS